MSSAWKTVRVFISSTFRDMHAERDHLVRVVFPALRERLEPYRVYLVDVDLRWGVTREQAENNQATELCLQQVDACRPFFLGILGERYGWVPTAFPATLLARHGWVRYHAGKSVTDLEMLYGVAAPRNQQRRAFFYLRDPAALVDIPADRRRIFADDDPEQQSKLRALKERIRRLGYPLFDGYPAAWDAEAYDRPSRSRGRLAGLETFGQRVQEDLWAAIGTELHLPERPPTESVTDPLAEEQDYHERFAESRLRVYVGREDVQQALLRYADSEATVPLVVTGPSGLGKSAALARLVTDYRQQHPEVLVVPHFIGASPRSTSLRTMLRRLALTLKERFGLADDIPEETSRLLIAFRDLLSQVPPGQRLLLVIDALNQLDTADQAHGLLWLPRELLPHVKVVASCISDPDRAEPMLDAFRQRPHQELPLEPLREEERREVVRAVPSLSAKALDDRQIEMLLSNPATANPLYLLVALEELRGFGSYEQLNERIASLPHQGDTITALFDQVLQRLEEEFDAELVRVVLMLLASARRGLSERELRELVEAAALPGADDLFPVLRQLRPYLLSRAGLLDFYHRNLFKAVRARYLSGEEARQIAHACLAEYFHEQSSWLESPDEQRQRARQVPPTARPANTRKVDEVLWQRLQAHQGEEAAGLLLDPDYLEAKTEAGLVFDLAGDFTAVVGALPGSDRRRLLALLEEALRRDIHFLARHPTCLLQCLWNSGWWYDCPEAAVHYVEGRAPGEAEGGQLHRLLEQWRAAREKATPGFPWLRSLQPPPLHLGTAQQMVLRGHEFGISALSCAPNGWLASGSWDRTVRIWDGNTGQEVLCLRGHEGEVRSVCFSADGRRLVSGAQDGTVRLWDTATGDECLCLRGHQEWVNGVCFTPDGRLVSAGYDQTVRLWDVARGTEVLCLRGHEGPVWDVSCAPDGRLASGGEDGTVRLWDLGSGQEQLCLSGHQGRVSSVSFAPDGRRLASGAADQTVRVWDTVTGQLLLCVPGREGGITCVRFSPSGRHLARGTDNAATVRVYDADSGQELLCLQGHETYVAGVAFTPDGRRLVSGSGDQTLRLWDTVAGGRQCRLRGHENDVYDVTFAPDGRMLASGGADHTVWLWDAATGRSLLCLRGHENAVNGVTFAPDDRRLASAGADHTVRLWDPGSGRELRCLRGHGDGVYLASFSRDGRRLVSLGADHTVRLWDTDSGQEVLCVDGVASVRGTAGKWWLMGEGENRAIAVWDETTGECVPVVAGPEEDAPVTGTPRRRLRVRRCGLETVVEETRDGPSLAWFPAVLPGLVAHPVGHTWAAGGKHLSLLSLEGRPCEEPARGC